MKNTLFENLDEYNNWHEHWQNMPEFKQENKEPYQQIIISFENKECVEEFSKLINQKITYKTKSLWFPKNENYIAPKNFLYKNEE